MKLQEMLNRRLQENGQLMDGQADFQAMMVKEAQLMEAQLMERRRHPPWKSNEVVLMYIFSCCCR